MGTPNTEMRKSTSRKPARNKDERLEARLPVDLKELLKKAARLEGLSLSDFVINAASASARQIIRDHEIIELSRVDQIKLAEALINPPKPTAKQKRTAKWYLEELGK